MLSKLIMGIILCAVSVSTAIAAGTGQQSASETSGVAALCDQQTQAKVLPGDKGRSSSRGRLSRGAREAR